MVLEEVQAYDVSLSIAPYTIPLVQTGITLHPIVIETPLIAVKLLVKDH